MSDVRHVVLVKPGDLLLISNIGEVPREQLAKVGEFFQRLGIETVCFAGDVDIEHAGRALQAHLRAQLGKDDCGCGGCDACAQVALVSSLAPE